MASSLLTPLPGPAVGSLLLGKYRLEGVLGEGGMGVVYAGRHLQLDERVAVKLVRSEHANTVKLAARLVSEAKATVRLKSDHVVRILDAGTLEDGQPFIVMEYLEGEDLSRWRNRQQQPPLAQTIDYLLQACEAVAEAHSLGIVHRDLKPANLFLQTTATGARIKVLDFGISRVLDTASTGMSGATSTHSLVGSPAYASPEQLTTPELVDTRTDIWSLGVVCYELLSGKSPFSAASLALVCTRVLHDTPPRLRALRRDAPAALERAVLLALQKRPQKRPQTIAEWAEELAPFGSPAARDSLARIQSIKRAPPLTPAAHRSADADPAARTLTEWISRIIPGHALESGRTARLLLFALALPATLALSFGVYRVLAPTAPAETARAPVPPPAASPALRGPSQGVVGAPPVTNAAQTTPARVPSQSATPPALPAVRRRQPQPVVSVPALTSAKPASSATPAQPVDPYLHRK